MRVEAKIGTSVSCLSDKDVVNKAYSGLLAALDLVDVGKDGRIVVEQHDGGRIDPRKDFDVFTPFIEGIYIPGSERNYWCGYLDPVDCPPPESGCVYIAPRYKDVGFEFITIKRLKRLPKKVVCGCKKPSYIYKYYDTFFFKERGQRPFVEGGYFAFDHDGVLWTVIDRLKLRDNIFRPVVTLRNEREIGMHYAAGAISLLADRKYLWNIRTAEESGLSNSDGEAIVNFGVEEDLVKSLVYARDEPITKTGRKRPILHWVDAHKRRIKKGIQVDVRKHLRGVTSFKMGELDFQITEPDKAACRRQVA